jgi:drug/metabolite transporter (DMT)-like permease
MPTRLKGITLVVVASVLWSTAGLFVRAIDMDPWTMLAWRSLCSFLTLAAIAWILSRGHQGSRGLRLGWRELLYLPFAAISMMSYVLALRLTSVANVMVIYATVPFLAAGLGFLILRERAGRTVLIASSVAFVGICITAGTALARHDMQGNAIAFAMTFCFAVTVVLARQWPHLNLPWVTGLAAALCAGVCFPLASRTVPTAGEFGMLMLFSLATQSIGYVLFLLGARLILSAQAGLIALLDVVLSPLWVLWAFNEVPSRTAMIGGGIILSALLWHLTVQLRHETPSDKNTAAGSNSLQARKSSEANRYAVVRCGSLQ